MGTYVCQDSFDEKIMVTLGVCSSNNKVTYCLRLYNIDAKGKLKHMSNLKIKENSPQITEIFKYPWKLNIPLKIENDYLITLRCQYSQVIYLFSAVKGSKLVKLDQELKIDLVEEHFQCFQTKDGFIYPEKDGFVRLYLDIPEIEKNTSFIGHPEGYTKAKTDKKGCNLI